MDPLITNGVDPALLRVLEKRGQERDPAARRRRPPVPEKTVAEDDENEQEPGSDTPKHTLDDLA
jgi:hypothetical protein